MESKAQIYIQLLLLSSALEFRGIIVEILLFFLVSQLDTVFVKLQIVWLDYFQGKMGCLLLYADVIFYLKWLTMLFVIFVRKDGSRMI